MYDEKESKWDKPFIPTFREYVLNVLFCEDKEIIIENIDTSHPELMFLGTDKKDVDHYLFVGIPEKGIYTYK